MTEQSQDHPADKLAIALERSSGLLNTIADLYDKNSDRFVGGEAFAVHAISTAASLIHDARNALADLHYYCDLTMLEQVDTEEPVVSFSQMREAEPVPEPKEAVDVIPMAAVTTRAAPAPSEEFAQSYLELLNKLTAAEIFAAEQQALAAPGESTELLPLLKSLREDIQKIHSAA